MDVPFYVIGDHNAFCIVDAIDHTTYHFRISNQKLYYVCDQQQYLVISETVTYSLPYYTLDVLVAYKESLEEIKQRPLFEYIIDKRYLDSHSDFLSIEDHRCGSFLPHDPFTIYTENSGSGSERISTWGSKNGIRAHIFYRMIIRHLMDTIPCQICDKKYSRDAYESTLSFSLYNYKMTNKCVSCATKEDGVFEVDIENFTIRDAQMLYQFELTDDSLFLIKNNNKFLVFTSELHEPCNESLDDGALHEMVYKYKLVPALMVRDEVNRLLPDKDPHQKIFGIRKFTYFRDTVLRLLHTQLCVKCKTSRNLKGINLSEKEYFVHGHCQNCFKEMLKQAMNSVFSHKIEKNTLTIFLKETNTPFEFVLKDNKIFYNDKLVIFILNHNTSVLKLVDEADPEFLKHGESLEIPDKLIPLDLPPVRNLKTHMLINIEFPYRELFNWMLYKIAYINPCQWCGSVSEDDRSSFIAMNRGCYCIDTACKQCWNLLVSG